MEEVERKNISRYYTFGLREEWIKDFFKKGFNFFQNNSLGPYQELAFKNYLKDSEVLIGDNLNNCLFQILNNVSIRNYEIFWSIIWINMTYNSNIFKWWTNFPKGIYKKSTIEIFLSKFYGKYNRSVEDACNSLVGTFERTPIGKELKQGIVKKEGRKRIVIKEGDPDLPPIVFLYNLYKFAERNNLYEFSICEIENKPLSPQKVFCTNSNRIENLIVPYAYQNIIELDTENDFLRVKLRRDLGSIDILSKYVGGEIK